MDTYHNRFLTLKQRFDLRWAEDERGCWLWNGRRKGGNPNSYGHWSINKQFIQAHRASWLIHRGTIPDDMCVLHRCDVPPCVNPDHLFLGTLAVNTADMIAKGRQHQQPCGEDAHAGAKLSLPQVLDICSSKETGKSLAAKYAVGEMTISRIRRGLRWGHLNVR